MVGVIERIVTRQNLNNLGLCFVALTIPFGILFNNIFIILFLLFTVCQKQYWNQIFSNSRLVIYIYWSFLLFFFIHFLGLFWSDDKNEGLFELEKKLSFVLFPLFILLNKTIDSKMIRNSLWAFVAGCLVLVVACVSSSFYLSIVLEEFTFENFSRDMLVRNFDQFVHPTDLSWYLIFCILIIIGSTRDYFNQRKISLLVTWLILCLFFIVTIFLLASRLPIICLVLLLFSICYHYVRRKYGLVLGLSIAILPFVLSLFIISTSHTFNVRFREIIEDYDSLPYSTHHNSTNIRNACFLCSFKNISDNILIGVGTGDVQEKLTECYKNMNFSNIMYRDKYNSHNQYLQTAAGLGFIGLMLLINLFFAITYAAYLSKSKILMAFMLLFSFSCLTESMLGHQKGIVFFTFFSCLMSNSSFISKNARNYFKE